MPGGKVPPPRPGETPAEYYRRLTLPGTGAPAPEGMPPVPRERVYSHAEDVLPAPVRKIHRWATVLVGVGGAVAVIYGGITWCTNKWNQVTVSAGNRIVEQVAKQMDDKLEKSRIDMEQQAAVWVWTFLRDDVGAYTRGPTTADCYGFGVRGKPTPCDLHFPELRPTKDWPKD